MYIGQWRLSPLQSSQVGTSHSSPSRHQLSRHIFLNLTDGLKSLSFQRWFYFWEKPEGTGHQICPVGGAESPGWLDVSSKNSAGGMMHEQACCRDEAANHQLPITAASWIIQIIAVEECSSWMQILWRFIALFAHFECSGHTVHMLTQRHLPPPLTSTVKLSLFTHAHSSPLSLAARLHWCHTNHSCYINNAGLFPDRLRVSLNPERFL